MGRKLFTTLLVLLGLLIALVAVQEFLGNKEFAHEEGVFPSEQETEKAAHKELFKNVYGSLQKALQKKEDTIERNEKEKEFLERSQEIARFGQGMGVKDLGMSKESTLIGPGTFAPMNDGGIAVLDNFNNRIVISNGKIIKLKKGEDPRALSVNTQNELVLLSRLDDQLKITRINNAGSVLETVQLKNVPLDLLNYAGTNRLVHHPSGSFIEVFDRYYLIEKDGSLTVKPGLPSYENNPTYISHRASTQGHYEVVLKDESGNIEKKLPLKNKFQSVRSVEPGYNNTFFVIYEHVEEAQVEEKTVQTPMLAVEHYSLEGKKLSGIYLDYDNEFEIDEGVVVKPYGQLFLLESKEDQFVLTTHKI